MKKYFLIAFFPAIALGVLFGGIAAHAATSTDALVGPTTVDTDHDGLTDEIELALGTDPNQIDSDGDNYPDGIEVANGFNPLKGNRDRSLPRKVVVNISTQHLDYFLNNVKVGTIPVSTGLKGMETPNGTFKVMRKLPVHDYIEPRYTIRGVKWNLEFKRGYYLHAATWHNQFGIKPMSHGCVNISEKNAAKVFAFMGVGDEVTVIGKNPAKPLAKQ